MMCIRKGNLIFNEIGSKTIVHNIKFKNSLPQVYHEDIVDVVKRYEKIGLIKGDNDELEREM